MSKNILEFFSIVDIQFFVIQIHEIYLFCTSITYLIYFNL